MSVINYTAITDRVITVDSEADLEFLLNNIDLTGIVYTIVGKGGFYSLVGREGGPIETPEVAAVFARLTSLSQVEQDAIRKFVNAETANGNWALTDEFFSWGLNATDRLIGFKLVTAINTGATFPDVSGALFNGVDQFINTNFIPNVTAAQYQNNNRNIGAYVVSHSAADNSEFLSTADSAATADLVALGMSPTTPRSIVFIGSRNARSTNVNAGYKVGIQTAAAVQLFLNGQQESTTSNAALTLRAQSFYVGARNQAGVANRFWNGTIGTVLIGASVGFDQVSHYSNLIEYLIDLDAFAGPAIDKAPAAFVGNEETYLRDLINAEVRAGNWQRYDSFFAFGLSAEANALWDWKRGVTATNTAAVHVPNVGFDVSLAVSSINTNYNASVNGINYTQNNALHGVFFAEIGAITGNQVFYQNTAQDIYFQTRISPAFRIRVNSGVNKTTTGLVSKSLIVSTRANASNIDTYVDGVASGLIASASAALTSSNIVISPFLDLPAAVLSSFIAGAAIGFNQVSHNSNLRAFLNKLEIDRVIARYSALTAPEEAAIRAFVAAEQTANNWDKTSEFFCWALNATDRLIGMVAKTAINQGATFGADGASFNGASQRIETGLNPSTEPLITQTDARAGAFIIVHGTQVNNPAMVIEGAQNTAITLRDQAQTSINWSAAGSLITLVRPMSAGWWNVTQQGNDKRLYFNDTVAQSNAGSGPHINEQIIGSRANGSFGYVGTVACNDFGSAVGLDYDAHYNNIRTLLTALGVTLP